VWKCEKKQNILNGPWIALKQFLESDVCEKVILKIKAAKW